MSTAAAKAAKIASEVKDAEFDPAKFQQQLRKFLVKQTATEAELAEHFDISPRRVKEALAAVRSKGVNFRQLSNGKILMSNIVDQGGRLVLATGNNGWTTFGVITDNHKGNKHHRQDVENAAYERFAHDGITTVLNAGNILDGEARFNKNELIVHGMDAQIDYWIDTTPQHKGIVTYFITGDDHEGWYVQRECINIGAYMQMKAEKAGRTDLRFLGHVEADVELKCGKGSAVCKVMHPGGGSSYAFSYAPQKIVESFQGGEKPAVVIGGHYHKFDYCYPREVHFVSCGTAEDQTMFMRKNKLGAHVGFVRVDLKQDVGDGHLTRFKVEWNPFYDRAYYGRRYDMDSER